MPSDFTSSDPEKQKHQFNCYRMKPDIKDLRHSSDGCAGSESNGLEHPGKDFPRSYWPIR